MRMVAWTRGIACVALVLLASGSGSGPDTATATFSVPHVHLLIAFDRADGLIDVEHADVGQRRAAKIRGGTVVNVLKLADDGRHLLATTADSVVAITPDASASAVVLGSLPRALSRRRVLASSNGELAAIGEGSCVRPAVAARNVALYRLAPTTRRLRTLPVVGAGPGLLESTPESFSLDDRFFAWTIIHASTECRGPYLGEGELHVLELGTGKHRRLDDGPWSGDVAFSHDGAQVAWVADDNGAEIRLAATRSGRGRTVSENGAGGDLGTGTVAWTSTHLIYALAGRVFAYDTTTGAREPLGSVPAPRYLEPMPAIAGISRDGRYVAYASAHEPRAVWISEVGGPGRWKYPIPRPSSGSAPAVGVWVGFG
jgi:hypothetical protein